ncbi:MAG: alpha-glucosidase [Oscillospiraceae bacterium]|nr:alpha-glucosidase [Oscillospiraceae bacterium]
MSTESVRHTTSSPWWRTAVIYQIYPRSFCDTNGDGIGDLPGIISKLDYLSRLGVDALWLSPVCCSPQADNGYDISDYLDIDPIFGTMEDMDRLILEAGRRGIRIVMDLVLNHSSDEHRWFLEAKKSRDNPYHDWYIWRDGTPDCPPRQAAASFGGGMWEWVPELGQYYYHQFSAKQPDLNWANPEVRHALYDMINRWTDRGIGGYRLDVADHLGKDPDRGFTVRGPRLHEYIREMSAACFQRNALVTVGEAWSADPEQALVYTSPDGSELSMVFGFDHMKLDQAPGGDKWSLAPLDFVALKRSFAHWQRTLYGRGWNSLFWENHDLPRIVSRFGNDGRYRAESAKLLAIALHGMCGTPFIYQGEELGMTDPDYALEDFRDIEARNMLRDHRAQGWSEERLLTALRARARDNGRTPMQWDATANAGFTDGEPWARLCPNYTEVNAASQLGQPDSVLECYRTLIRLRKEIPVLTDGDFELLLEKDTRIFAYLRRDGLSELLVLCNFSDETVTNPIGPELWPGDKSCRLLVSSYPEAAHPASGPEACLPQYLRPWEARMLLKQNQEPDRKK